MAVPGRDALAGTFVTSGFAGLCLVGALDSRVTLADADPKLTGICIASILGMALGSWLFFQIWREAKKAKEMIARLLEFQQSGLELVVECTENESNARNTDLNNRVRDWRVGIGRWVTTECPELAAPFMMPGRRSEPSDLSRDTVLETEPLVRSTLDLVADLITKLRP